MIARGIGSLAYSLITSRRRVACDNLRRAFGDSMTEADVARTARRVFQNMSRTFIELAHYRHSTMQDVRAMIDTDAEARMREIHAQGKGCINLTAHFGSWEMLGIWMSSMGIASHLMQGTQHNELVDDLVTRLRSRLGVHMITADRKGAREVMQALGRGELVGIVADQHAPANQVVVEFFGRKAAAPRGPAAFAIKAGCPLWPFLMRRERYDRHVVMAGEPIYAPAHTDQEEAIRAMTQAYMTFFENGIRQYPDQWMWTHRRWKLTE
jgi:KDO2-lipid IV(A) lauroyltransferase